MLVVRSARYGQPDRVLGVVQIEARCAGRDGVQVWSAHAAGSPSEGDRSAEQAVAADRFAREIVGFLNTLTGALAAAERQALGRALSRPSFLQARYCGILRSDSTHQPYSSPWLPHSPIWQRPHAAAVSVLCTRWQRVVLRRDCSTAITSV